MDGPMHGERKIKKYIFWWGSQNTFLFLFLFLSLPHMVVHQTISFDGQANVREGPSSPLREGATLLPVSTSYIISSEFILHFSNNDVNFIDKSKRREGRMLRHDHYSDQWIPFLMKSIRKDHCLVQDWSEYRMTIELLEKGHGMS